MQDSVEGNKNLTNSQMRMQGKSNPIDKGGIKLFPTESPTQKYFE